MYSFMNIVFAYFRIDSSTSCLQDTSVEHNFLMDFTRDLMTWWSKQIWFVTPLRHCISFTSQFKALSFVNNIFLAHRLLSEVLWLSCEVSRTALQLVWYDVGPPWYPEFLPVDWLDRRAPWPCCTKIEIFWISKSCDATLQTHCLCSRRWNQRRHLLMKRLRLRLLYSPLGAAASASTRMANQRKCALIKDMWLRG